jgi:hypothetical protein
VETYEDFMTYAKSLDFLEGRERWKLKNESSLYDYERIEARYNNMKTLRKNKDIMGLVRGLRSDLQKNLGGIANPELYDKTHCGTKRLIEKYHNEAIKCIRFIYYYKGRKLPLTDKLEFFAETRHSYGRTALLLSGIHCITLHVIILPNIGGATFGRFHFGVIKALYD